MAGTQNVYIRSIAQRRRRRQAGIGATAVIPIADLLARLEHVKPNGAGHTARCPGHDDARNSLSIGTGDDGRILLHCHAGCEPSAIVAALGIRLADLMPVNGKANGKPRIAKFYDYTDADGHLFYQVVRMEPKDFRQRRPDGRGGWVWNLHGVERVPYRLPELLAGIAAGRTIYVPEGEKDADRLASLGLVATCNAGGAGKWPESLNQHFRGADVVILVDNDEPGRKHGQLVARSLHGIARSVRVVALPGLPSKGDVSDWLDAGNTKEALEAIIAATPIWMPPAAEVTLAPLPEVGKAADDKPILILPGGAQTITRCAAALYDKLAATGQFYLFGGRVATATATDGNVRLEVLNPEELRSVPERHFRCALWRAGRDGEPVLKPAVMTRDAATAILACAERERLPRVSGLSHCPLILSDGRMISRGFDPESGILVTGGAPPVEMTAADAAGLLRELVEDFDFVAAGDHARALAAFITPALRLGGFFRRAPIDVAEADHSQAGKNYRHELVAAVYGSRLRQIAQRAQGGVGSFDESLASALNEAAPFIQLDNLRGRIDSPYLESMLTSEGNFPVRVPHRGEILIDPRRHVLLATSNAMESTPDLANRCVITRIRKRPAGYRFRTYPEGDVLDHVRANQGLYLGAVFAVIRAWIDAGKPSTDTRGHDFREWAGALDWIVQNVLGAAPMLDGHDDAKTRISDPAQTFIRALAVAVTTTGNAGVGMSATELYELAVANDIKVPGLRGPDDQQGPRRVGGAFRQVLKGGESAEIDGYRITTEERDQKRSDGTGYYSVRLYSIVHTRTTAVDAVDRSRAKSFFGKCTVSKEVMGSTAVNCGAGGSETELDRELAEAMAGAQWFAAWSASERAAWARSVLAACNGSLRTEQREFLEDLADR